MAASYPGAPITWSTAERDAVPTWAEYLRVLDEIKAIADTLGLNPQGGVDANVTDRLARNEASLTGVGSGTYRNLRVDFPTSGTLWTSQVRVRADGIAVDGIWLTNIDLTADLAVLGVGGRDTGSEAANTWYSVWLGTNNTGSLRTVIWSLSTTVGGLTLGGALAVYTHWRLVDARRNGPASNLYRSQSQNGVSLYDEDASLNTASSGLQVLTAGAATAWTAVSCAVLVPPVVRSVRLLAQVTLPSGSVGFAMLASGDSKLTGAGAPHYVYSPSSASEQTRTVGDLTVATNDTWEVRYRMSAANVVMNLSVIGYTFPV